MPDIKYEQLSLKPDNESDVFVAASPARSQDTWLQKSLLSLGLILLYFSLSIGLTFYQRWLLEDFHFPLSVVMYHLVVKWLLSVCVRTVLFIVTGTRQLVLPFVTCLRSVCLTGVASGIDVGFSNWGLELVTISLYTMTKSTTIIFILSFAILLGLEKKSWSLVGIVMMIAAGLLMFTYKATQFNLMGFNLLLVASLAGGLRWTFAQLLMQKAKLGLHNPIDMVYHVQPWMFISILPCVLVFEGNSCYEYMAALPPAEVPPTALKVTVGATIAFAMEISEFLVVTYTSSLTLSIAGIFKEMCILALAVGVGGDVLSGVNAAGLLVCLLGISGHIVHKLLLVRAVAGSLSALDDDDAGGGVRVRACGMGGAGADVRAGAGTGAGAALLGSGDEEPRSDDSDSDRDASRVLFEVIQRRDAVR